MNGDGEGVVADNTSSSRLAARSGGGGEDPDRVCLEEYHQQQHHHHHHYQQQHHQQQQHNSNSITNMRVPLGNPTDLSDSTRLSPDRTSIFEDLLPSSRNPSRHVSPARDSPSPSPEAAHTPAPTNLSATPPPTLPPSSFAATSSTRATSTAGTSEASFEVLSGYEPISPAERHRLWQREQRREAYSHNHAQQQQLQPQLQLPRSPAPPPPPPLQQQQQPFRPNADLPFPITPQLLRYYPYSQAQGTMKEEFVARRYSEYQEPPPMSPQSMRSNGGAGGGGGGGGGGYDARFQHRQGMAQHYRDRGSSSEVSVGGSSCSGIPSFAREFEGRGWRFDPILTEASSHNSPPPAPPSSNSTSNSSTPHKEESIASIYVNEFASQLDLLLRYAKRPFVALMIVGFFGLLLSALVQNFSSANTPETWERGRGGRGGASTWNSSYAPGNRASYADFPTLMNIESSFEKIVDSAAGGSALARVMKQSEMAVSDLSTVVRYSELKCKETLAERLDVFARDAKGNVRALQGFGSKVGGVLDQLLSINQYALRELTMIQRESQHRPFLSRLLAPTTFFHSPNPNADDPRTRARVAETFNKAAEVLESNLRLLVADGETIFTSLTQLTEQHKPIYDEIVREVVDIKKEEAVVLSSLWTKVGGNAAQRKNFRENAELLALIGSYEEQARGYVESTVLELDRMTADLENLRRRVAEPLLVPSLDSSGDSRNGVGSSNSREEAAGIPLSVHLEAIETAVDRLVRKRRQRRDKEGSWKRRLQEGEERGMREEIFVEGGRGTGGTSTGGAADDEL